MKKRLVIAISAIGLAAGIGGLAVPAASADEISASSVCAPYWDKHEKALDWATAYKKSGQLDKAATQKKKADMYYIQYKKCLKG